MTKPPIIQPPGMPWKLQAVFAVARITVSLLDVFRLWPRKEKKPKAKKGQK